MFLPDKIRVGFQNRGGTYTGKLAYVVYYDEKNKLRKERSFESWRDSKIETVDYENIPQTGFVLNKKAGGYSSGWNHRNTYARIYDPRGFEFEITMENLLYILEHCSSIKGKEIEGELVYGWDSGDLVLLPVESLDYKEYLAATTRLINNEYIKPKDLIPGASYRHKNKSEWVYMGRFNSYNNIGKDEGLRYFFYIPRTYNKQYYFLHTVKSPSKILIEKVEDVHNKYGEYFEEMQSNSEYSPIDKSLTKKKYLSETDIKDIISSAVTLHREHIYLYIEDNGKDIKKDFRFKLIGNEYKLCSHGYGVFWNQNCSSFHDLSSFIRLYKPFEKSYYLSNGRFYCKDCIR